jgi:GxxExxY protein
MITKAYLKHLTYLVNGACIDVHKATGPGLMEKLYAKLLKHELNLRNISFKHEMEINISYKGLEFNTELRCDLLIENCLLVELKAQAEILPIHHVQCATYMKLLKVPKGIIYNFNVASLYLEGQETLVNKYYWDLPD